MKTTDSHQERLQALGGLLDKVQARIDALPPPAFIPVTDFIPPLDETSSLREAWTQIGRGLRLLESPNRMGEAMEMASLRRTPFMAGNGIPLPAFSQIFYDFQLASAAGALAQVRRLIEVVDEDAAKSCRIVESALYPEKAHAGHVVVKTEQMDLLRKYQRPDEGFYIVSRIDPAKVLPGTDEDAFRAGIMTSVRSLAQAYGEACAYFKREIPPLSPARVHRGVHRVA